MNRVTRRALIASIAFAVVVGNLTLGQSEAQADGGYRLPFQSGLRVMVTQTWNSSYSHNGIERYAYDFKAPEGTPVVAVKDGRVVAVKRDVPSDECGGPERISRANYVALEHEDGTQTIYVHLSAVGPSRVLGSAVRRGQVVGWVGKTGWTGCASHLHFARQKRATRSPITQSIPIYFDEQPGAQLLAGRSYTSGNTITRWW